MSDDTVANEVERAAMVLQRERERRVRDADRKAHDGWLDRMSKRDLARARAQAEARYWHYRMRCAR